MRLRMGKKRSTPTRVPRWGPRLSTPTRVPRWGPRLWRSLVLAATLHLSTAAGLVSAQTVIATNAPPRSTVEFVLNTTTVGSTAADASGNATLTAKQPADQGKTEMDAHIYVDTCDNLRRVLVVERSVQPSPQDAGCQRAQVAGVFLVRPVSTLVVNVEGPTPTVLLRQGRFTLRAARAQRTWSPSATGLVLSGGGGLARISDPVAQACGDVMECSGDASGLAFTAGAAFWFTRFLAAEAAYLKPAEVSVDGREANVRFNSSLDAHVLTLAGKAGVPIGPVRLYGKAGATYHQATFATTQTSDDVTVTNAGVTTTIEGGTQTYELKTAGWGWMFGGGIEAWLKSSLAIYAEGGRAALKGSGLDDADGAIDDGVIYIVLGARVRIGR